MTVRVWLRTGGPMLNMTVNSHPRLPHIVPFLHFPYILTATVYTPFTLHGSSDPMQNFFLPYAAEMTYECVMRTKRNLANSDISVSILVCLIGFSLQCQSSVLENTKMRLLKAILQIKALSRVCGALKMLYYYSDIVPAIPVIKK